jgi:molybdopterin-containing oxidoreductase family membrane subunit
MSAASLPRASNAGFVAGLIGAVLAGGFVIWQLMSHGHAAFNATSTGLMWGLPIITYDYLLMTAVGLTLVASLWTVFGVRDFEAVARRAIWMAVALLAGAIAALFLELPYPLRALYAIPLNFQVHAPLFWKVIGIAVFAICLALFTFGWLAGDSSSSPGKGTSVIAMLASLIVLFAGAMMYGTLSMRPFWYAGELPVVFIVEALLGAVAFLLLATPLAGAGEGTHKAVATMSRLAVVLIVVHLLFLFGRMATGLASNLDGMQVWQRIAASPLFWLQVIAGFMVPLVLLATGSKGSSKLIPAVLLIVGLFIGKYEFVISGQLVPLFKGSWVHGLIEYAPSATEWVLLATAVFVAYAVYAFGAARFRLGEGR